MCGAKPWRCGLRRSHSTSNCHRLFYRVIFDKLSYNRIRWVAASFQRSFCYGMGIGASGFYSTTSTQVQREHAKSTEEKGKQWQKKFRTEIWKQWSILWKRPYELFHAKTQSTRQDALRRTAAADLRAIYDTREQLDPEAQQLFFQELQDHIQRHQPQTTRNWLHTNAPILRESLRRAKRRALAGVRSIHSYFAPVR